MTSELFAIRGPRVGSREEGSIPRPAAMVLAEVWSKYNMIAARGGEMVRDFVMFNSKENDPYFENSCLYLVAEIPARLQIEAPPDSSNTLSPIEKT